jgi:AcrR family transcriptional regulator
MARPRSLPDSNVYAEVLALLAADGEKGVTFSSVSQKTGLAGASLVQRYGSLEEMLRQSLGWGWSRLEVALAAATAHPTERPAQGLLKEITDSLEDIPLSALLAASQRHADLRARAAGWRQSVETVLSQHSDSAPVLYATWMGQWLWEPFGGKAFRLKDVAKKLA